jgi:hypothetical protein
MLVVIQSFSAFGISRDARHISRVPLPHYATRNTCHIFRDAHDISKYAYHLLTDIIIYIYKYLFLPCIYQGNMDAHHVSRGPQ